MKHINISEPRPDLFVSAAEQRADVASSASDVISAGAGCGATDAWVYQSVIQGMVQAGALKVTGK